MIGIIRDFTAPICSDWIIKNKNRRRGPARVQKFPVLD